MLARVQNAFRALRHRNLRNFFAGQIVSLTGRWMQDVALAWLVYRLTDSALLLGIVGFASQFPTFVMAPLAGALADRWDRYRLVVFAQWVWMIQAFVLAGLVLTGHVEVWHVVVLSVVSGLVQGIDIPSRQSLIIRLVGGREDLPNAIALNSSMMNLSRLVGPAVAGVIIGVWGEGPIFVINAVTYVPVLVALASLRLPPEEGRPSGQIWRVMQAGFEHAFGFAPIRDILLVLFGVSLIGIPYTVLLPVFARDILGGDARTLGVLTSAVGFGALSGALYLASRNTVLGLAPVVAGCIAAFGAALVGFAFSTNLLLSCALLMVVGFGVMTTTAGVNTILQSLVGDAMRGRVMAIYTMAFIGTIPIGSLAGGALASRLGAPVTVALGGVGTVGIAIWFAHRIPVLRPMVLPVYEELGIIPEVARGLQSASEFRLRS